MMSRSRSQGTEVTIVTGAFSAHRASAVSDTDVPWTSIAVMI